MSTPDEDSLGGRLRLLRPDALDADQQTLYRKLMERMVPWTRQSGFKAETSDGRLLGPFNPMLFSPGLSLAHIQYLSTERRETTLPPRVREVIILSVGAVWKAAYELYAHTRVAQQEGLEPAVVEALAAGRPAPGLTDGEQVAHEFTHSLVAEHRVAQPLYDRAVDRFGERGVADMVHLIGLYLGTCAMLNAFAVPVP